MTRKFEAKTAIRTRVPGLIALAGPPGGGKTESALKLASGMIKALPAGSKIGVIDSEACRALHYAPKANEKADPAKHTYVFEHLDFKPPHGSEDYREATDYMIKEKKVSVIIYDSATHEHTGTGGVLQRFAQLVDELAAKWKCSAGAATPSAWRLAKEARKVWVNELEQQRDVFFIFCFRAKEGVDFEKKGKEMDLGWEPEGGKELWFQMGLSCLLPARSDGKPLWSSPRLGDMASMKLPYWAKGILDDGKSINEDHGLRIAQWLLGGESSNPVPTLDPAPAAAPVVPKPTQAPATQQGAESPFSKLSKQIEAAKTLGDVNAFKYELSRQAKTGAVSDDQVIFLGEIANSKLTDLKPKSGG